MAIITNHDVGDYLYPSDNPYDIPCLLLDGQAGALAVCLWDKNGWHYAWAPVVRWLDMRLEKEK